MTAAQTFAEFGAQLSYRDLAPEVIHHAKRAVVDWYAALLPGAIEAPATLLEQAMADDLDRGPSHLAMGRAATPRTAALINAAAAHTVEVDDIYREAIYHPGAPTIAAALAMAQAQNASGLTSKHTPHINQPAIRHRHAYIHVSRSGGTCSSVRGSGRSQPCAVHRGHFCGGLAASLSNGFHVQTFACGARCASGFDGRANGGVWHHRVDGRYRW